MVIITKNVILSYIINLAFWRFYIIITSEGIMKDIRISIRLTEDEHKKFKVVAAQKNKKMQDLLSSYVKKEILRYEKENKN